MDLSDAVLLYRKHTAKLGMPCERPERHVIDRGSYWYFVDQQPFMGRKGTIIRKNDGLLTDVGSGIGPREVVFWAYEHGILTGKCDLIIKDCGADLELVIDVLTKTPPSQRGLRLPGPGREQWRDRLTALPVVIFSQANLENYVGELWAAERDGIFLFEVRPVE